MVTDSNPSASSLVNDTPGHEVLRDFSLVAANSGGSIVLGGLLANKPLSEIVELYKSMSTRNRIFHRLNPEQCATVAGWPEVSLSTACSQSAAFYASE